MVDDAQNITPQPPKGQEEAAPTYSICPECKGEYRMPPCGTCNRAGRVEDAPICSLCRLPVEGEDSAKGGPAAAPLDYRAERAAKIKSALDMIEGLRRGFCLCGYAGTVESGKCWKCGTDWGIGPDRGAKVAIASLQTPKGFDRIEAYSNGKTIVVMGEPPNSEATPDEENWHDCDAMGCGTFSHVIAKFAYPPTSMWMADSRPLQAEITALAKERDSLREALEAVKVWRGVGKDHLEYFEDIGEMFYSDTGYLRPGKSEPMETFSESREADKAKAWREWCEKKSAELNDQVLAALAAAPRGEAGK